MQREGGRYAQLCAWGVALSVFVVGLLGATGTAHAGAVSAPPNNLGLVGYWSLNEGSGTVAGDFSGSGNTGSFNSDPQWTDGRYDQGLLLDGTDDFLSVDHSPELDVTTSYTLSAWIKPNAVENYNLVFFRGTGSASEIEFYGRKNDTIILHNRSGSGGTMTYKTGPAFTADTWMHVAITYNNSASEWKVYYDGVEQNFTLSSGNGENPADNDSGWRIGKNDGSFGSSEFNGTIDEVRIYNRALSASEVRDLYQRGLATIKQPDRTNLVGYWSFDEGGGSTVDDFSGRGQLAAGSVAGSPSWVDGRFGSALQLNGSSQYVTVPDHDSLSVTTAVTMAAWVKPAGTMSNYPRIIQKGQNTAYEVYIHNGTTRPVVRINGSDVDANQDLPIDEWTLFVATYDTNTDTVNIYYDGELVRSGSRSETAINTNSDELRIGTRAQKDTAFNGIMDEVRIYESALSAAEVSALYESTRHAVNSSRNTVLTDGLVGLWSFDGPDIDDTTAYDRSGGGNDGTRSGTGTAIGVIGQALSFDGVDDHVVDNTPNVGVTTGPFTVSFWMKPHSASGRMMPFSYGSNNTNQSVYFDWADSDQNIEIEWWGVNGVAESGTLALNEWHHVVGKYDGSRSYIYIDGKEAASIVFSDSNLSDSGYIGAGKLISWGGEFDGDLDDVRMYNRALSANEILRLYRIGR